MANPRTQYVFDENSAKTFTITKEYENFSLFLPFRNLDFKVYSVQLKLFGENGSIGFGNMGYDPDGKFYLELTAFYDTPERLDLENGKSFYLSVEWNHEQIKSKMPVLSAFLLKGDKLRTTSGYLLEVPVAISDTNLSKGDTFYGNTISCS
jgi:hypothetical protein